MNEKLISVLNRIERAVDAVESETWNNNDLLDELKDILKDNTLENKEIKPHESIKTTITYIK